VSENPSKTVLVVDDHIDIREMFSEYLRCSGYEVEEAADGAVALEKVRRLQPSVILTDLTMPGIDGCEMTRRLKADEQTRNIIVIAVSAHSNGEPNARAAGCDGFVSKPVELPELAAIVDRAVRLGIHAFASTERSGADAHQRARSVNRGVGSLKTFAFARSTATVFSCSPAFSA
jgi:CheY-like chemotaxis protein